MLQAQPQEAQGVASLPTGDMYQEDSFASGGIYIPSIDNLIFIIKELIEREDIPTGLFNVADDEALPTNYIISIIAKSQNRKLKIWKISKGLIYSLSKLGDLLRLPLTTERLEKLTESYVVSNEKINSAIGKDLPVSARDGFLKTFTAFNTNVK
jgi:hypothetical protein